MTSTDNRSRQARVLLDGKPIAAQAAGADVHNGLVTVQRQRLYSLISFPHDEQRTFTIQIPPGISAYDFTFG
jgi:thioredoxin family protein